MQLIKVIQYFFTYMVNTYYHVRFISIWITEYILPRFVDFRFLYMKGPGLSTGSCLMECFHTLFLFPLSFLGFLKETQKF